jgi:inorganic pyrophosphatase
MGNLTKLPSCNADGAVQCIVETPRGSRAKFKYDCELKLFTLSKSLLAGLSYPYDWGFIPSTRADDGDPLDVMIIHEAATYPGMLLCCDVIGVLEMNDVRQGERERNDRVFVVPRDAHHNGTFKDVRELPERMREELEAFFAATTALQKKNVECLRWSGPKKADSILEQARSRYSKHV